MALARRERFAAVLPCLLIGLTFCWARDSRSGGGEKTTPQQAPSHETLVPGLSREVESPVPTRTFDLRPLDFRRVSQLRGRDGFFHVATAFFDENHLLFTFEGAGVVKRLRNCPSTHDDRIVHAVVVDIRSGEVLKRVDWYLHDRQQYLWGLASGKVLLRRQDSLFELDTDLTEKPLLERGDLFWVDVTPDGLQIIAGVTVKSGESGPRDKSQPPKYEVRFLDATTLQLLKTIPLDRAIPQKATRKGYADVVLKGGWTWLVRFGGPGQPRAAITRVRSVCIPDLEVSGENTLLIGRCTTAQDRYVISSFTTSGQFLWRHHWDERLTSPLITRSSSGARFALSSVDVVKQTRSAEDDSEDSPEIRRHRIEVFNSATGTALLRVETQPAVTVGGNAALSPEGTVLTVLRDARLELYQLPKLENDEAAKLAAVRAETPGLVPPGSTGDPAEDAQLADDEDPLGPKAPALASDQPPTAKSAADPSPGSSPLASAPAGSEANRQPSANPGVTFHSRAEAVVVDVVVTDSKGRSVPGLKTEDFSVVEDGVPQKVSYFAEHSVVDTQQTPPPEYKRAANVFTNVSNTSQPDSATLILLDMLNTPVLDQGSARDALMRYIKKKPKNESFALCVLSSSLRLVRGFTTDENELLLSMNDRHFKPGTSLLSTTLDTSSLNFIRNVTQRLDTPADLTRTFAIAMAGLERTIEDEQLSQDDMRTYMTIQAFEELATYMAGVPGRKKVLWLSAAFPLGVMATDHGLDAGPFHQQRNFVPLVSKTMNLLASAHVSVYPVDVRGVTGNSIFDITAEGAFTQNLPNTPMTGPFGTAQQGQAGGGGQDANAAAGTRQLANDHAVPNDGFLQRSQEDAGRRNSEHSAMDLVAEQTGGKAFYGSNDITDALRTVVSQGADYYTLSYTPTNHKYDGRFRKIHVKVAGHSLRVAHRSGYYAEDPNRRPGRSEAVLSALSVAGMLHGAPESRQIPFQVRLVPVGEPKTVNAADVGIPAQAKNAPSTMRVQHYSVDYAISAAPLRFDPGPEGNLHGNFRLLASSFDSDGRGLLQASSTAVADLKPDNYRDILSQGLRLHQELDLPAGAGFLRLGVGDMATSYTGTLELPLPVAAPKDDALARKNGGMPPVEPE